MPRDLFASQDASEAALTTSPLPNSPLPKTPQFGGGSTDTGEDGDNEFTIHGDEPSGSNALVPDWRARANEKNDLHPYVQTLSRSNVDSCVALENVVFPENERCSKEKFHYRLTTCPELSLGVFSTTTQSQPTSNAPTYPSAFPPDSFSPAKKSVLIAHVVATKCTSHFVTEESMGMPRSSHSSPIMADTPGHHENGRTIAVHSLGVLPEFQRKGLGKIVMKSYIQRMESSGISDRIALLAHDNLIKFYESLGFDNRGKSDVGFGGGGWTNMVYDFAEHAHGAPR